MNSKLFEQIYRESEGLNRDAHICLLNKNIYFNNEFGRNSIYAYDALYDEIVFLENGDSWLSGKVPEHLRDEIMDNLSEYWIYSDCMPLTADDVTDDYIEECGKVYENPKERAAKLRATLA